MAERIPDGPVALVLAGGDARAACEAGALGLLPVFDERRQPVEILVGTSAAPSTRRSWQPTCIARPPRSPTTPSACGAPSRGATCSRRCGARPASRGWSVVFHAGGGTLPLDQARAIEYVATPLHVDHLLASAAIPTVFPAVRVRKPAAADGWYRDGGTRLNTPIRPALKLGAKRVVVIGLHSIGPPLGPLAAGPRPDAFAGAAHILQGLLADPLAHDTCTLAGINDLLQRMEHPFAGPPYLAPYIFVAPTSGTVGQLAVDIFRELYAGQPHRAPSLAILERMIDGSADELLSHLFLAPEFADVLLAMGRDDARRWLSTAHDEGPWHHGPLPGHEDALEPE